MSWIGARLWAFLFTCEHLMMFMSPFWEKAMASHTSTLAWKIPWMEEPGGLRSMGLLRVGHNWVTSLSLFTFMHWRRKWQPTPVFLPGKSQGWGSLVGCRLWGHRVGHDWSDLAAAAAWAPSECRNKIMMDCSFIKLMFKWWCDDTLESLWSSGLLGLPHHLVFIFQLEKNWCTVLYWFLLYNSAESVIGIHMSPSLEPPCCHCRSSQSSIAPCAIQ